MASSYTSKVQAILRDRYPLRFREIKNEMKDTYPFTGSIDSYKEVTRYNSMIYNRALRKLAHEYPEEYVKEMKKFSPNYQKVVGVLASIKINVYPDTYTVAFRDTETQTFLRTSETIKYVSSLLKELNK